jgi:hypothetical protein
MHSETVLLAKTAWPFGERECRFRYEPTSSPEQLAISRRLSGGASGPDEQANSSQGHRSTSQNLNNGSTRLLPEVRRSVDDKCDRRDNTEGD